MTIEEICRKYWIIDYTINSDGTIDYDGDLNLGSNDLTKLPLKFNKVSGYFSCGKNKLTSLEGCPKEVGGNFDCSNNKLTSLEGGPKEVGGSFDCGDNKLTDLKGCPKEIGGSLICYSNKITSLEFYPEKISGVFKFYHNPIDSLFYSFKPDLDIIKAFNSFRILKDGTVNLKRLKYLMTSFNKQNLDIYQIKKHYQLI